MPNQSPLCVTSVLVDVDDLADLREVIAGVGLDLLRRQPGARLVAAAGVADQGGVVADDQDRLMAQFLEQPQLAQRDGVAEVNVDAGRVDAVLDAQRLAGLDAAFQLLAQLGLGHDLLDAAADQGQSVRRRTSRHGLPSSDLRRVRCVSEYIWNRPTASKALTVMDDRRLALVRRPTDGQHVEAGRVVEQPVLPARKCSARSVSRRCLAASTEAAGRSGSSPPVERTSTKTMQSPSRAIRSSSPSGQG